jgi:hypothetical protein
MFRGDRVGASANADIEVAVFYAMGPSKLIP